MESGGIRSKMLGLCHDGRRDANQQKQYASLYKQATSSAWSDIGISPPQGNPRATSKCFIILEWAEEWMAGVSVWGGSRILQDAPF